MVDRAGVGIMLLSSSLLLGCSAHAEARPRPKLGAGDEVSSSNPGVAKSPSSGGQAEQAKPASNAPEGPSEPSVPEKPVVDANSGERHRSLPELTLKLSGLHIGGGPNDVATKRPFIETLETGFEAMRACYVDAEEPEKGGSFGVDLHVGRGGGHPTIQSVRTAMKGDKFKACVQQAFQGLEFHRPAKGPTVFSVSVRFTLQP